MKTGYRESTHAPVFRTGYWLAHCEGYRVDSPDGRVGVVEHVRLAPDSGRLELLRACGVPKLRTDTESEAIYRWNRILAPQQGLRLFRSSRSGPHAASRLRWRIPTMRQVARPSTALSSCATRSRKTNGPTCRVRTRLRRGGLVTIMVEDVLELHPNGERIVVRAQTGRAELPETHGFRRSNP